MYLQPGIQRNYLQYLWWGLKETKEVARSVALKSEPIRINSEAAHEKRTKTASLDCRFSGDES